MRYIEPIAKLIAELGKLPSVGEKTAARYAYALMEESDEDVEALLAAIKDVREKVHFCKICGNFTEDEVCEICATRKPSTICVVKEPKDVTALEKVKGYEGVYHVLHGVISPLDRVGPEDIRIKELLSRIDGSVKDTLRCELRERFKLDKQNSDALDILLFTEVGSEGLDYQFCNMMINYDLPWNPMRIEQRIGRIDRRGQQSEVVQIYNVITADTVDADIYNRCLIRIGVFERSIGDCEEILGEIGSGIEKIAMDVRLTDEERRKKLEQIADNEVLRVQELERLEEEEKGLFGFDLTSLATSDQIQNAESPWLTPPQLQLLTEKYLNARLGEGAYFLGGGEVKTLRLSVTARATIREDFLQLKGPKSIVKMQWDRYLKGNSPTLSVTFEQDAASQNQNIQFITTVVHRPSLMILDEPFSGFDPVNAELIRQEILRLKDEGATIILSTHNMESVEELCDEIALINKSHLVITGAVDDIRRRYGNNNVELVYTDAEGQHSEILPRETGGTSTLEEYIRRGVTVNSYRELMPRMNDIFIKLVTEGEEAK